MADLIALPYRASDATFTLVSDATAYFYEAGTSTPLTVYTDSGLGTPRGTSVAADSEGVFAQCWVASGTGVKVDVKNGAGTSLPGFPQDNYPTFSASGTGAGSVTFSAITGNSATDVQTAIANETARNNTTDNAEALATSGGSGGTFTLTSTYTISAYAAGMEYEFIANQASVGSGSDTLNVDSVGAVVIKKYANSTTKTDLSAGEVTAGDIVRVKHDGTHFVLVSPTIATTDSHGLVEAATTAEMTAGTAEKFPDAAKVKAYVDGKQLARETEVTTTGGNEIDFTSIPAGVNEIIVLLDAVSLSAGDLLIQIGDSGGVETSGYLSSTQHTGAGTFSTAGFIAEFSTVGSNYSGAMTLWRSTGNKWIAEGTFNENGSTSVSNCAGSKTLSAELDRVRLTSTSGGATFDVNGGVNILYR